MQQSNSIKSKLATIDVAFDDPVSTDPEFPPFSGQFYVNSRDSIVRINVWLAGGAGEKGVVIISPPLGGTNSMNSNILALNNVGIHVIAYQPRGVRDGNTEYSIIGQLEDGKQVVQWIVANAGEEKRGLLGPTFRFDAERIAALGFSGAGGNTSFAIAAESPYVNYAIAISPGNMDYQTGPEAIAEKRPMFDLVKEASGGYVDYERWLTALNPADVARISIIQNAPKLVSKHLLMMAGVNQTLSPYETVFKPNESALREAGVKDLTGLPMDANYGLSNMRPSLSRIIVEWLINQGF